MKELLRRLAEAERKTTEIDEKWVADPENEELEREWDEAYKIEFELHQELVKAIVEYTKGQITENIAKRMVATKREELTKILEKAA